MEADEKSKIPFAWTGISDNSGGVVPDKECKSLPADLAAGQNNSQDTLAVLSERTYDFMSNDVSVGGIKYVAMREAVWFRRAIWLMLVVFGFGFMIFQFHDRIKYYVSNPTTVDIKSNYKNELVFPTVTICNENLIDKDTLSILYGLSDLIPQMYPAYPNPTFTPSFDGAKLTLDYMDNNNISWSDLWVWLSPLFTKEALDIYTYNEKELSKDDFKQYLSSMGGCLQFNGVDANFTATRAGSTFGLSVLLSANQSRYTYARSLAAGFRVLLHNKNKDIPAVYDLGFKVPAGSVTSAAIQLKTIKQLPKPYGNCSDSEGYSYRKCVDDCLHQYVIQTCGCKWFYYEYGTSKYKACNPEEQYFCAEKAEATFITKKLLENTCTCPPQCVSDIYQYTLSTSPISDMALQSITDNVCNRYNYTCDNQTVRENTLQTVKSDYTELQVYFNELLHEEVTTVKAYPLLALLCDIGGALGLILGSTVLTLFEVFDFLVVFVYDYITMKKTISPKKDEK